MNDNDGQRLDALVQMEEEAGLWCARMQAENAAAYQQDFNAWLMASPGHKTAYDKALAAHERCGLISGLPGYGPDRDRARELQLARRAFGKARFWETKSALAASLVLGAGLGTGLYFRQANDQRQAQETYKSLMLVTRLGEVRTFALPDGSALTLDTQSRAEVTINGKKRSLRILSGRVRLNVAKAQSPFEIDAGTSHIAASEGLFDLVMEANRELTFRPITGQAELAPLNPIENLIASRQTISAGQTLSLAQDRYGPLFKATAGLESSNWPDGWVDCNGMPLSALVDLANRYSGRKILIDAPASEGIGVSGRIKIGDTNRFLRNIADQYDLQITENSGQIILRGK